MSGYEYCDPRRQDDPTEHGCTWEDGEWWFGHGMGCRRPELHETTPTTEEVREGFAVSEWDIRSEEADPRRRAFDRWLDVRDAAIRLAVEKAVEEEFGNTYDGTGIAYRAIAIFKESAS